MAEESRATEALAERLSPLRAQVARRAIEIVAARLPDLASAPVGTRIAALLASADTSLRELRRDESLSASLEHSYRAAETPLAKRDVIEKFLRAEVRSPRHLRRDLAAQNRWLDLEAVQDRLAIAMARRALETEVALEATARELARAHEAARELARGGLAARVAAFAAEGLRAGIRAVAIDALTALFEGLSESERVAAAGTSLVRRLVSWASEPTGPRWVQVAAMHAVAAVLGGEAVAVLRERLRNRRGEDDFIARANAVSILGSRLAHVTPLDLYREAAADPSESVRQAVARALVGVRVAGANQLLVDIACRDGSPAVRGVGVECLAKLAATDDIGARPSMEVFVRLLRSETNPAVLRVLLEELPALARGGGPLPAASLAEPLSLLAASERVPAEIRELAAATARALEVDVSHRGRALRAVLAETLARLEEGAETRLVLGDGPPPSQDELVRALAVAARGDMTVSLRHTASGWVVARGERRRRRLWRVLHELATPMPDKRQAFRHTAARASSAARIVIPAVGMAELTATRVPGERRLWPAVGGWAPFVPRVDDLLSVASWAGAPLVLVTSLGTVTLRAPPTLRARLRARVALTWRYAEIAEERDRALASEEPSDQRRYIDRVRELGFEVSLGGTTGDLGGARFDFARSLATRFLGAALLVPFTAPSWMDDPLGYGLSPRGNTLPQLAWFAWIVLMFLLVRAALQLSSIERARRAIPLTIGGWGTRGKSGSERLKAALFQGLGYQVAVKTTGCEAMFIHAVPGVPAQEVFIYRAYDKSTIWEQRDLVELAAKLHVDVFLWECMALRERFIKLLLHEWMSGQLSTLTNAYPDHEDQMGPSGEDVARVIAQFMPRGGTTITAEEQMLPILAEAARHTKTDLRVVRLRESDLLPADVLARFPYQEHPRNIALVAHLAEHLGVPREVALIEMADHVVPDIGVLKTYPEQPHRGRSLFFSNGMSANERAGFLANWTRLGLDEHDPDRQPELSVVTVVNNRADRVSRSRVFAKIMVEDCPSERQIVIGSNLSGMRDFVETALADYLKTAWVRRGDDEAKTLERFDVAMKRLKVPTRTGALREGVARMLRVLPAPELTGETLARPDIAQSIAGAEAGAVTAADALGAQLAAAFAERPPHPPELGPDLRPDVAEHARRLATRIARAAQARRAVREAASDEVANAAYRAAYRALFLETVVYFQDEAAKGDAVIDFVARQAAPGQRVHILGVQNIKGTGLDFVYRWLSIDRVEQTLARMKSAPTSRAAMLNWLLAHKDFGLLDSLRALGELRDVRRQVDRDPAWAPHKHLVETVLARIELIAADHQARLAAGGKQGNAVLARLERLFDHFDSIRRRRIAQRVLADLVTHRIGRDRAALLLREVTDRQKGGWLEQDLRRWLGRG